MANAGIDRSNVAGDEDIVYSPEDPDGCAEARKLRARFGADLGVAMSDSFAHGGWALPECGRARVPTSTFAGVQIWRGALGDHHRARGRAGRSRPILTGQADQRAGLRHSRRSAKTALPEI